MVRKCKIVAINDVIMVIDYDGILVQLPSNHTENSYVFVKRDTGNKFSIVPDGYAKTQERTVSVSNK